MSDSPITLIPIYSRYVTWRRTGVWDRVLNALQLKLDEHGLIDYAQWGLYGTVVRTHRAAAGARKKGAVTPEKSQTTAPLAVRSAAS